MFTISVITDELTELHYLLLSSTSHTIKTLCNCPTECEYCNYDEFVTSLPINDSNAITLDVHFDGPTGVSYKREIVVTHLDMLGNV